MKFLSFVLLFVLSLSGFCAEIKVLSSIKPLSLIVDAYAGDLVISETLLAAEESPHHMSFKVSQLRKLQDADMVIWVGPDLEPFLEKPLKTKNTLCFSCLPGLVLRESFEHDQTFDPHLWLDLDNVAILVKALSQELQQQLPQEQTRLVEREQAFLSHLQMIKAQTREKIARNPFLSYHSSLNYFVSAYQLPPVEAVMEGGEAGVSAAHMAYLKNKAESFNCLIADIQEGPSAQRYAKQLKLPLVEMDFMAANKKSWWEYYGALGDVIHGCSKLNLKS